MSDRRGFILLTALWLVVAISAIAMSVMATARLHAAAGRNRLSRMRSDWARDACVELLLARYDFRNPEGGVDTTDLGRGAWCRALVFDPSSRLDVTRATERQLGIVLEDDSLAAAIADWQDADSVQRPRGAEAEWYRKAGRPGPSNRPVESLDELRLVRGFERVRPEVLERLAVQGSGLVNVASADPHVIATLPGFEPGDVSALQLASEMGKPLGSLSQLADWLREARSRDVNGVLPELAGSVLFTPRELVIEASGGVRGSGVIAHARLRAVPLPQRLAIAGRVVW